MKEECEVEANYKDCGKKTHLEWVDDCCLDLHEFRILQLLRKDFFLLFSHPRERTKHILDELRAKGSEMGKVEHGLGGCWLDQFCCLSVL